MSTAAKPPSVDLPPLRPQATRGQPAGKPKFVSDRSFFGQKTKKNGQSGQPFALDAAQRERL